MNDMPDAARLNLGTHEGANTPPPPKPPTRQEVIDWLTFATSELTTRRDETVLPAIRAMIAEHPAIADGDEDLAGQMTENLQMAKDLMKEVVVAHKSHKRPYLDAGTAVDGWKNQFEAKVTAGTAAAERIILDYLERKRAIEQRERAVEAQRALIAANRARVEAEEAAKRDRWSEDAAAAQAEAQRKAAAAERTERATHAGPSLTRGDYGASSGLTRKWKWRMTDITKVPSEYLLLNEQMVQLAAKQRDKATNRPLAVIPGIEWYEDVNLALRS